MRALIAYDGSESADQAVALVAGVDWPSASEVRIVTAYLPIIPDEITTGELAAQLYQLEQEDAEQFAASAQGRVGRPGLVATSEVTMGRAATVILEAADRFRPDLLVVGSRGRGPFTSALLGSVSEELVDHAPCAVIVARGPGLARVLLADDGSGDARAAADLLTGWPIFRASQVRVMSVVEPTAEAGRPAAEQIAGATAARLRAAGLPAEVEVRSGDPAEAIVTDAGAWPADLIAIGTRGQTGLTRLLRGSVARKVLLHAHCSVLIQRQR